MISTTEYERDLQRLISNEYPWSVLSGQSILVTGATGMIGSMLSDVLISKSREHQFCVTVLSRNIDCLKSLFGVQNELLKFVANMLDLPKSAVELVGGATSHYKKLKITGEAEQVCRRLEERRKDFDGKNN